ncbi:uncharacterized protein N7496_009241 [Penicillium cataractarum]|uniref:Rhodopsin domain-containing protein n=1 Tax=Penicillium cataractarum TaxID=2100454 RepID=A0A9W9RNM2_9EURO|nr:uncharacterized protein N7496_009241 [Penicillium cataractarum]KAJ5363528.1 hypothetical protein N7496_009241 [Penicillium cataractarum]
MSSQQYSEAYLAQSRGKSAEIGMYVVTALSTLVVLVRLYARGFLIRDPGWDDYIIVASQLFAWADMVLSLMTVRYGAGEHLMALVSNPAKMVKMYKWLVAAQMVYFATLWLCRVSGLAFFARLNPMPRFKLYIRLAFAFVTAVWISQVLIIGLQCIPLQALWDSSIKGTCMGSTQVFLATSVMTIICDSLILVLPIKIVWKLQVSLGRKITLLLIFCFGIFAIVTSILRMVAMVVALDHPSDITWYFSVVMAWSTSEIAAMIIALSLPALRGLFGFFQQKRSTNQSNSRGTGSIGLTSVQQSKRRVYSGPNDHQNTTGVDTQRSSSQEALWDIKDGQNIRIMDTVHVDVHDVSLERHN